ncbi:shikimate kinase [Staphylococcus intermedius]|uniref:shikimate kinase n=1 Tax=Staphylococcus intermedius TaxID=1285 RepID=UPI000319B887|nr:shikimate kinase [Staphylococcus intermedius]PCF64828.1 shikimate kinase [Staphylococcus intermedius]PCF80438.1 shikimate kinase [Staphylococcus intermedius]PCF81788.1 shikimate kinase [Staphylococcus intermedius]PCF88125.1 shikimate kinase [Staphylococcus intermedius]PCF88839.1 shikimate kinase [Staphylococcus intermedius]
MNSNSDTPLIFIGFMGAGKSTIAQSLAEAEQCSFIDLDTFIETETQKSIPQIFDEEGEAGFRQHEYQCLKKAMQSYDIIAVGGGILTHDPTYQLIKDSEVKAIWVDAPMETLYERVKDDPHRPNANKKSFESLKHLYSTRISRYNEIAFIKVSSAIPLSETLNELKIKLSANDQY